MHRGMALGCYSFCIMVAGAGMTYAIGLVLDAYTSDAALEVKRQPITRFPRPSFHPSSTLPNCW